jgi:hypothetical protein
MPELSFSTRRGCAFALVLSAGMAALSSVAARVTPPPRTPATAAIVIEPGETRSARARFSRERSNIVRDRRNLSMDDSRPDKASSATPVSPDSNTATRAAPLTPNPTMGR